MAYSISVAVGDSDTMAVGRAVIRTVPLAADIVVGNEPVPDVTAPDAPLAPLLHAAPNKPSPTPRASRSRCGRLAMWSSSIESRRTKCARCDTRRRCPTNRPSSEDRFRRCRTGVRARPPRGHHRCGTAPGSHRPSLGLHRSGWQPKRQHVTAPSEVAPPAPRPVYPALRAQPTEQRQMGATSSKPMAFSSAAAERITTRSACWGPTSWIPTGRPSEVNPAHTDAAGDRVMLKG